MHFRQEKIIVFSKLTVTDIWRDILNIHDSKIVKRKDGKALWKMHGFWVDLYMTKK